MLKWLLMLECGERRLIRGAGEDRGGEEKVLRRDGERNEGGWWVVFGGVVVLFFLLGYDLVLFVGLMGLEVGEEQCWSQEASLTITCGFVAMISICLRGGGVGPAKCHLNPPSARQVMVEELVKEQVSHENIWGHPVVQLLVVDLTNVQWHQTRVEEVVDWWSEVGDLRESRRKDEEMWEVGSGGGEVKGGGVVLCVVKSSLGENPDGAMGVGGEESRGVEGGAI
ncbi:hypothetical protein Tco_0934817 [Tanacetum coccineum]